MARKLMTMLVLAMIAVPFVTTPGCSGDAVQTIREAVAKLSDQRTVYERIMADANSQLAQASRAAAAMPDGPDKDKALKAVAQIQTVVNATKAKADQIAGVVDQLNQRMAMVQDEPGLIEAFSQTAGTALPAPVGLWVGLAGALVAGVWRSVRNKQAALNIVRTVDKVLTDEQKALITGQSVTAKAIVDQAQGKLGLPL